MKRYLWMCFVIVLVVSEEHEGLIGSCWFVPSTDNWRVIVRRSERHAIMRAAKWEEKMNREAKERKRAEYRMWLDNCHSVRRLIA